MLDKLEIENFMIFEKLDIPTLKRVNLIAGKNNSGKTSLLDAIRILVSVGDNGVINNIVDSRGNYKEGWDESYEVLFTRGVLDSLITKNQKLEFLRINDFKIGFDKTANRSPFFKKVEFPTITTSILDPNQSSKNPKEYLVYAPFNAGSDTLIRLLWEKIALTEKEDFIYEILQRSIDPDIVRIVISNSVRVRLKDAKQPVPLKNLGDGVYRVLLIALSLVNAQNSILLIDEIESGLHYTALEKLWQIIFEYSQKWNIQVFVTTHSQDAIKTFQYVASDEKYISDAQYIRLQIGRDGKNEAILFDSSRLRDSLDLQLEIR
jgi:AAA15 family ATPase/GTPase